MSAASWAGWLGWDHIASYDSITGQVEDPYVTVQVTGCLLSVALLTAALAAVTRRPVPAAAGASVGFWVPWTLNAVLGDDSGLSLVGSVMVVIGLVAGTGLAAAVGVGLRRGAGAVVRWRTDRSVRRGERGSAAST